MKNKNFFFDSRDVSMLPRNMRDEFFGRDTKNFNFAEEGLNQNERAALDPILRKFEFKSVYRVPRVNAPEGIHTPDLLINGVKVEIKSLHSAKKIQNNIEKARNQIGENGIVVIDVSQAKSSRKEIEYYVKKCIESNKAQGFIVRNNSILFGFQSKKLPATAGFHPTTPEAFQSSIISPTNNKINQIFASSPAKTKVAPVPPTFKPRQRTKSYWARRSEQRMNEALKILNFATKTHHTRLHGRTAQFNARS